MKNILLLPLLLLTFSSFFCQAQRTMPGTTGTFKGQVTATCESMRKVDFFDLARKLKEKLDNRYTLSLIETIEAVKIYNTSRINKIQDDSLNANDLLKNYRRDLYKYYFESITAKYGFLVGKGGTIYINKLDLYWGWDPESGCTGFYSIY